MAVWVASHVIDETTRWRDVSITTTRSETTIAVYRIRCAEVWGGTKSLDEDVCSAGIVASVHSTAYDSDQGGDMYYFSVCENDNLTRIAIADMAGHGCEVSDVSGWLHNILVTHMNDTACDVVLEELNDSAMQHGIRAPTTAAVVGVRRKSVGSWQPLALNADTTLHTNAPLGVQPDALFDQQQLPLVLGDRPILHTDAVTEAMNSAGELFGDVRLRQVLDKVGHETLPMLKRSVLDAVAEHTACASTTDDVTLPAIEIGPITYGPITATRPGRPKNAGNIDVARRRT